MLQEELGVRAARLKGITDVVPPSRNGSADSDSGDEDSDVKKGARPATNLFVFLHLTCGHGWLVWVYTRGLAVASSMQWHC
jgi:hypothetical protein